MESVEFLLFISKDNINYLGNEYPDLKQVEHVDGHRLALPLPISIKEIIEFVKIGYYGPSIALWSKPW